MSRLTPFCFAFNAVGFDAWRIAPSCPPAPPLSVRARFFLLHFPYCQRYPNNRSCVTGLAGVLALPALSVRSRRPDTLTVLYVYGWKKQKPKKVQPFIGKIRRLHLRKAKHSLAALCTLSLTKFAQRLETPAQPPSALDIADT